MLFLFWFRIQKIETLWGDQRFIKVLVSLVQFDFPFPTTKVPPSCKNSQLLQVFKIRR